MKNRQSRVLDTVHRVQRFLDDHADVIGPSIASARQSIDSVDGNLSGYAQLQSFGTTGSRGETNRQRALRAALRYDHIRPIAEVARQKLREVPEFSSLGMPRPNATSTQLVTFADAMAAAAAPHEQVFKEVGLPDDFIASLKAAAGVLAASVAQRSDHTDRRVGATAGLAAEEKRAASMIRLLDAIVRPKLGANDALLREWKSAKRVPLKSVPAPEDAPSVPTPGSTPGPTPAPTPTATATPGAQAA